MPLEPQKIILTKGFLSSAVDREKEKRTDEEEEYITCVLCLYV